MRKYIFLGFGSFLGAVLRYLVKGIQISGFHEGVPINTLLTNILGAFLIAFLLTIAYEVWKFDSDVRLGLTTGLLGAFTTFSTLCKEIVGLWLSGFYRFAFSYMAVSVALGLTTAFFGVVLARQIGGMVAKRRENAHNI